MLKTLDLLIIRPNSQKRIYGPLSNSLTAIEPPLWPALIAAYIRNLGFSVKIIDSEADNLDSKRTVKKAIKYKPNLIVLTITGNNLSSSTSMMTETRVYVTAIKKVFPKSKILLWGLHPSALPEKTLQEENTNYVCQGEGFYTIRGLLNQLKEKKEINYAPISGLCYYKGKEIEVNSKTTLIKNLDGLPSPAWDLLPMKKYRAHNWHSFYNLKLRKPYGVIYTSFGCGFNCDFCALRKMYGEYGVRYRSPKKVIEDIDILVKKYKIKNLKILDECFILKESHVMAICDLIIERGYDLNIWAYSRVDTIKMRMLKKLKKAGFNWLALGFESGNEGVRKKINKNGFNNTKIEQVVAMINSAGINIIGNFIFGLPEDNLDTMKDTLTLAKKLNCEFSNFNVAMAYPGSKLYEDAVKKRIKLPKSWAAYSQTGYETFPLSTKFLSNKKVLSFRDKAFLEFYKNKIFLNKIKKKFGEKAVFHIKKMTKIKLKRKLLEK